MKITLLLIALASSLSAGLIVESGTIFYPNSGYGINKANFGGAGFHIFGSTDPGSGIGPGGWLTTAAPTADISVVLGYPVESGILTYLGNQYTALNPYSTPNQVVTFLSGPKITINGAGTYIGTFTATGVIRYNNGPYAPPWNVADETFTGQGWVELKMGTGPPFPIIGDVPFFVESYTYHFAPEPWSAGLVACPLAWLAYRRRRLL